MAFVDQARIEVQAGGGGKGCESHYSDKYTRFPICNGGDGGDGASIILRPTVTCTHYWITVSSNIMWESAVDTPAVIIRRVSAVLI